jgi:hypothetical protein
MSVVELDKLNMVLKQSPTIDSVLEMKPLVSTDTFAETAKPEFYN